MAYRGLSRRRARSLAACVGTAALLAGCATGGSDVAGDDPPPPPATGSPRSAGSAPTGTGDGTGTGTAAQRRSPEPSATSRPAPGTVPPRWLGTRPLRLDAQGFGRPTRTPAALRVRRFTLPDTLRPLPGRGFASRVTPVPREVLARSTWRPGCPVGPADLRWVRLTFRGFDGGRHTGELLVHRSAARDLVTVFRTLWRIGFPLEEMRITRKAEQSAHPTGDGNNTGAFNCRTARGQTSYSEHAYGLAVDLNPFQNPYVKGDLVLPELASAYRRRDWHRPGMVHPGSPVVDAFARVGWGWGGAWRSLKDYQHFSARNR